MNIVNFFKRKDPNSPQIATFKSVPILTNQNRRANENEHCQSLHNGNNGLYGVFVFRFVRDFRLSVQLCYLEHVTMNLITLIWFLLSLLFGHLSDPCDSPEDHSNIGIGIDYYTCQQ